MGAQTQAKVAPKRRMVVTATTGIAACAIGGITIHSFAGVGTGDGRLSEMVGRVVGNQQALQRWRQCDCLIIDEISMMSAGFFDMLNTLASRTRNDRRVFGGMQVVVCGDFFQLPPIDLSTGFAFEAKCWSKVIVNSILLKQVFRQSEDEQFMGILNEARVGDLSPASVCVLRTHSMVPPVALDHDANDAVKPTLLECRNQQVDQANAIEMSRLTGEEQVFEAKDFRANKSYGAQLKQCAAPERLGLKVGAQVILLKNLDPAKGLVNGTRGIVVDFRKAKRANSLPKEFRSLRLPVVQFESVLRKTCHTGDDSDDKDKENDLCIVMEPVEWTSKVGDIVVCSRFQIPLRLAWALSVHKSQGMTIPHLAVSLKGVFEYGQAYVALSRATGLRHLVLRGFNERAFAAHPKVKAFYHLLMETTEDNGRVDVSQSTNHLQQSNPPQASSSIEPEWTEEQLQRMEENRRRALAIRGQKEKERAALLKRHT